MYAIRSYYAVKGRVLYRLVEEGEMIGSGGRALVVLDLIDTYMTIFLPTSQVGLINIGSQARIILDALPNIPIPATVSFISPEAQFTPKEIETATEREKLMFRVKVKISPELLQGHLHKIKCGLPGVSRITSYNVCYTKLLRPRNVSPSAMNMDKKSPCRHLWAAV